MKSLLNIFADIEDPHTSIFTPCKQIMVLTPQLMNRVSCSGLINLFERVSTVVEVNVPQYCAHTIEVFMTLALPSNSGRRSLNNNGCTSSGLLNSFLVFPISYQSMHSEVEPEIK